MRYPVTPDGRYFVVRGRLWRCTNPKLSGKRKERLVRDLMQARRIRDKVGVDKAKRALGERGPTWWRRGRDFNRYLVKNTPYAVWWNNSSPLSSPSGVNGMAVKQPTVDNDRKGAVKKRTQSTPYTKHSEGDGRFMAANRSARTLKGVRREK